MERSRATFEDIGAAGWVARLDAPVLPHSQLSVGPDLLAVGIVEVPLQRAEPGVAAKAWCVRSRASAGWASGSVDHSARTVASTSSRTRSGSFIGSMPPCGQVTPTQ